jgi:hypothetical protein
MHTTTARAPAQGLKQTLSLKKNETPSTRPDQMLSAVGARLVSAAKTFRHKAARLPGFGFGIPLLQALEDTGFFLQGRPTENFLDKTGSVIRRRPVPFMLIGAALGFLLARGKRR